jgi:hypothetical protein
LLPSWWQRAARKIGSSATAIGFFFLMPAALGSGDARAKAMHSAPSIN